MTSSQTHAGQQSAGWLPLLLLCAAQFMVVLDGVIVNVALAEIQRDLELSPAGLQWVVNAYTLVYGGFLLLGGRVADLFGRRRVFVAGLLLFAGASFAGGLATSGALLIAARAVQGLGGALISPASLSLVTTLYAEGPARDRALGAQGAVAASGAASGVLLGGVLVGFLGWQWVLLVNVPIGIAVAAGSLRVLPADPSTRAASRGFDLAGAISVTAGLALLVYGLVGAEQAGWGSPRTLVLIGVAVGLLASFVAIEQRSAEPLVRFGLLRSPRLAGANLMALVHTAGPMAALFFLSLYLQRVLGYTPLATGLAFLPFTLAAAAGAGIAPRFVHRLGLGAAMASGMGLMASGTLLLSRLPLDASYLIDILPGTIIVGFGITLAGVPMFISAVSGVANEEAGLASGLINTSQQVGSAVVLAVLVAVAVAAAGEPGAHADAAAASMDGFRAVFRVAAGLATAGGIVAWICVRRQPPMDAVRPQAFSEAA